MATMIALQKTATGPALVQVPKPEVRQTTDVRVKVTLAGICRTDLLVAEGRLPSGNVILGHEFTGVIDGVGSHAPFHVGQRVAVNPIFGCGACAICATGDTINCPERTMLGVDHDGAFAEYVVVPEANVYPIPDRILDAEAAYVEPIAAALGLEQAKLPPSAKGVILGRNRFATLVQRLLSQTTVIHDPATDEPLPSNSFDFAIETQLTATNFATMVRLLKPRGTLVLKSRSPETIAVSFLPAIKKQLHIATANYGPFANALDLLLRGTLDLAGLLGPTYPLSEFERAFAEAKRGETAKVFLRCT